MLARYLRPYSFALLLLLIFLLGSQSVEACSCGGSPTVLDSLNYSEVVVVVNVVSVEKAEPAKTALNGQMSDSENYVDGIKSTTTRVEQVFKGTLKVGAEMVFEQGGGGDCVWTFAKEDIGKRYLFYLRSLKDSSMWIAGTCGRSSEVEHARDDLLYLNNLSKVRDKTRISGTVQFNRDLGDSLTGRKVRIVGADRSYDLKTDDKGVYEIYDLPAGRYFVEPEVPKGWKVGRYWLGHSPSIDRNAKDGTLEKIPVLLEAKKHAGLDIMFEIDNAVRGHIYDPLGQPMKGVCLHLLPSDNSAGVYLGDCTEEDGSFVIDMIPPGPYVLIVNDDGKVTSSEPFETFYYPKVTKREEATVLTIGLGDRVEDLEIYPPIARETVRIEGVLLYSDGKPVAEESVYFDPIRNESADNDRDKEEGVDRVNTDRQGRFSIRLMKGVQGTLIGSMYSYVGEFENCPKLDRLIKQAKSKVPQIFTPPLEIRATSNLSGIELKYQFPSCKKAKTPDR